MSEHQLYLIKKLESRKRTRQLIPKRYSSAKDQSRNPKAKSTTPHCWWMTLLWCMTLFAFGGQILSRGGSGRVLAFARSNSVYLPSRATAALSLLIPTTTRTASISDVLPSTTALFSTQPSNTCETNSSVMPTGYLNAADAAALDADLMSVPGYSLEQLMELAGLAVAEAVYQSIPPTLDRKRKILLICGPGNNGGDGLVAARHLFFFQHYDCVIVYPKRSSKQHFVNLVQQCEDVDIPFLDEMPSSDELQKFDAIVDSIFGFSFKGEPRDPFATIMTQMIEAQRNDKNNLKVISVDVPSGWNVDEGDVAKTGFVPDILISLTTPKMCSKDFQGRHFVGGRFLPPAVASKYNVQMPPYPGTSQVMEVTREQIEGESAGHVEWEELRSTSSDAWREEYEAYLAEKYAEKEQPADTPSVSAAAPVSRKDDEAQEESWLLQYAKYCAEKEAQLAAEDSKYNKLVRRQYE